ncbi:type II toxin-antitoxin system Phd/YefM family antitoxin [Planomonospora sp. ID67723]|uniref:type II toxin-antitoxin system Phd/YefM family antitoxin n=1 Tax=Planomonospora sp. ID67723 TaxID=2738134 RepID=UPI0018C354B9|nr:type II toxin-antitoxin system Phd/YefM family antitoxin [Planomonospora sp. ID67723]MBG0833339.1 type II toxin-antitoxin system Phd/YefM family antitoxin [Planomonospora sp. ID67723]
MEMEQIGIVEARKRLGTLVSRAVHGHIPVRISRSADEHAVLIGEEEYAELQRLRAQAEVAEMKERMAAVERGEARLTGFAGKEAAYAHFGVPLPGTRD